MAKQTQKRERARKCAKPLPGGQGMAHVAAELEAVSCLMYGLAGRMEYFAGLNEELLRRANELSVTAIVAAGWAEDLRILGEKQKLGK